MLRFMRQELAIQCHSEISKLHKIKFTMLMRFIHVINICRCFAFVSDFYTYISLRILVIAINIPFEAPVIETCPV
jgi:hypothetical protein